MNLKYFFLLFTLLFSSFGFADISKMKSDEFLEKTGYIKFSEQLKKEVVSYSDANLTQVGKKQLDKIFSHENIKATSCKIINTSLTNSDTEEILQFYNTSILKKIQLNLQKKTPSFEEIIMFKKSIDEKKVDVKRVQLINEIAKNINTEQTYYKSASFVINFLDKYAKEPMDKGYKNFMQKMAKSASHIYSTPSLHLIYKDLDDIELRQLLDYSQSEVGKREMDFQRKLMSELMNQSLK
ncbi:MAG: hypothetical protein KN64_11090 [Sulfurovum sp. AS07-7]|nr:MAG: hypothetical protein KN64_11090 [Sulfurovum sp. AS07-7]